MNVVTPETLVNGSWIIDFAIRWLFQSTLLLGAGLAVGALVRRRGAAVQSVIYRATLLAVLAVPLVTTFFSSVGFPRWPVSSLTARFPGNATVVSVEAEGPPLPIGSHQHMSSRLHPVDADLSTGATNVARPGAVGSTNLDGGETDRMVITDPIRKGEGAVFYADWSPILVMVWGSISMFLLMRLLRASLGLRRLCQGAAQADAPAIALLHRLATHFGLAAPRLLRSPLISSACLTGILRPTILLPSDVSHLSLEEILAHELAHVRRRDCLWNLVRELVTAVLFFQPLLWLLTRRMEAVAEEVCDDCVIAFGADPVTYARGLVDLAAESVAPVQLVGVGIIRGRSLLEGRIRRLLDTTRKCSVQAGRGVRAGVFAGGVFGLCVTGMVGAADRTVEVDPGDESNTEVVASEATLRGVVQDVEGQPLKDAPVYLLGRVKSWRANPAGRHSWRLEVVSQTRTNADGGFALTVEPGLIANVYSYQVVAVPVDYAITFGPSFEDLATASSESHQVVAQKPVLVEGQILSPEGEPVSGAGVLLSGVSSQAPSGEWKGIGLYEGPGGLTLRDDLFEFWPVPVETDETGWFRLRATGAESVADLLIEADKFAPAKVEVATAETAAALVARRASFRVYQDEILDPRFTYKLGPARVFEGVVTDVRTGRPIQGVNLRMRTMRAGGPFEWEFRAETDEEGNYRIEAAPALIYDIAAFADGYVGYGGGMTDEVVDRIVSENGVVPHNFSLTPAVQVRGKVIDAATGRGIANAAVMYRPDDENPAHDDTHSFKSGILLTDSQGRFSIATLPGRGYLLAEVDSDEYIRTEFPLYENYGDTYPHGFVEIHVPEQVEWDAPSIELQKGLSIELQAVGPNGEAVEQLRSASVETSATMTHTDLESKELVYLDGKQKIVGLSPNRTYRTFLYSPDVNAATVVDLSHDPSTEAPRQVRLEPSATVRGRLVYEDGEPAKDIFVSPGFVVTDEDGASVDFWSNQVAILSNVTQPQPPNLITDANGEFERTGFFPGTYAVIRLNQEFADGQRHYEIGSLDAGEVRDLGTLVIKRKR